MDEELNFSIDEIESECDNKHHIINGKYRLRKINIWDLLYLMYGIRRKYKHTLCLARAIILPSINRSWIM